jgi:7,8-dihydropterin-6-yl-methyl-4-(beta-D-ribofuranosyl)aminobenzene 5'-phosphate synthase
MDYRIVSLMDNRARAGLKQEHGLSIYIESERIKLIFDTGMTGKFIENAENLGIELSEADYVVLSHGHYDHSGGLQSLVDRSGNKFKLFVGQGFFEGKYKLIEADKYKYIGNQFKEKDLYEKDLDVKTVSEDMVYIEEELILFRNFDQVQDFEKLNPNFVHKSDGGYVQDEFKDELVLGIKREDGIFLILGCSHPGFINILETVKVRTGQKICGVIGGTHLVGADSSWIDKVASYLEDSEIDIVATSHCTGELAEEELKRRLKDKFLEIKVGDEIQI